MMMITVGEVFFIIAWTPHDCIGKQYSIDISKLDNISKRFASGASELLAKIVCLSTKLILEFIPANYLFIRRLVILTYTLSLFR